jgi:hydroxyacylglutathione hydrolase
MYVEQFYVPKIAHSSYLLAGQENCAIVDPSRDVDIYIAAAKNMGFIITHILETHLHADFISGHMDLAEKTGARIFAPASADCQFEHQALHEGDEFKIDNVKIRVLETPGHTPEHIAYVVTDESRGKEPVVLFSGDTLFVGDVGRPDLFPGRAEELASKLFNSLKKFKELPDFCEVLPAHGAGSLCGRAMGAKRRSTIGYEKRYNEPLQIESEREFITSLTNEMPPAPDHFSRCSEINRKGPQLVRKMPAIKPLSPLELGKLAESEDYIVLDCRSYDAFAGQHIIHAYGIDFDGNFPTFSGWVIPPEKKILLAKPDRVSAEEVAVWLRRVGLDNTVAYLEGGMFEWAKNGLPSRHVLQVSAPELEALQKNDKIQILDVRANSEFEEQHIEGAMNIPAPDLREQYKELDKEKQYYVICSTGHRSTLAISLLLQRGFEKLVNVAGGMTGMGEFGENREMIHQWGSFPYRWKIHR